MSDVRFRLTQFIHHLKMDTSAFERECGLSNGFIAKTNDRIRKSSLNMISHRFPELNINWVITGEGEMLQQKPKQNESSNLVDLIARLLDKIERDEENISRLSEQLNRNNALLEQLLKTISKDDTSSGELAV